MKSIMEEASSIAKAVEKGWARAGKPQEFTVKVYEEAQTNFIGFTTKPAKIGLFFQETTILQSSRPQLKERSTGGQQQPQVRKLVRAEQPQLRPVSPKVQPINLTQPVPEISQPKKEHLSTSPWNPELVGSAQEWVQSSLSLLVDKNVTFTIEVDRYALKLNFNKLITQHDEKEKMLFRGWAYLIMQALRQKYKRPLKGLKVILMSNA